MASSLVTTEWYENEEGGNSAGVGLPVLAGAPRGAIGSVYELG
jgi:hypothetical protein